jgi:hypothetical protein
MKTKLVGIYLSPPDTARSSIQQRGFFVKRLIAIVCYLFLFQFFTLTYLTAQSYQSSGVVHDGTGALIPGAPVTVRQPEVPLELSSQTDDQGVFHLALPAAGTYQLEIGASGFKVYRAQIIVTADAPSLNLDIALAIEGNSQTVEVTADALAAETTSTQLGESLDTEKIQAVPLNGRSFTDLMAVQPGIVPQNTAQPGAVIMTGVASTPPSGDANPGNLSISGQRESSNGFRVNGSDVEEDVNMGTSILPNLDAIDSFRRAHVEFRCGVRQLQRRTDIGHHQGGKDADAWVSV